MIALNLPISLEKHFREVVRESYDDNKTCRPCAEKFVEEEGSTRK